MKKFGVDDGSKVLGPLVDLSENSEEPKEETKEEPKEEDDE